MTQEDTSMDATMSSSAGPSSPSVPPTLREPWGGGEGWSLELDDPQVISKWNPSAPSEPQVTPIDP